MQATHSNPSHDRYADCIAKSQRIRWDIDADVLRGRRFDLGAKFLPDALSRVDRLHFLDAADQRLLSQIQGRTYANVFGLVERFIGAKMLDLSRAHWLGDQTALEAIVRFADEELKHQELFRRMDRMLGEVMPAGYTFLPEANHVAEAVLGSHDWAVLALTCHIELFTQEHYLMSLQGGTGLCEIFADVFRFHWMEESQHAVIDELEWRRVHAPMKTEEVDRALDDLIQLIFAIDSVLGAQAESDCRYFGEVATARMTDDDRGWLKRTVSQAYRWQYLVSGFQNARFGRLLADMLNGEQLERLTTAISPLVAAASPE